MGYSAQVYFESLVRLYEDLLDGCGTREDILNAATAEFKRDMKEDEDILFDLHCLSLEADLRKERIRY